MVSIMAHAHRTAEAIAGDAGSARVLGGVAEEQPV
jgi:hypothetical protein